METLFNTNDSQKKLDKIFRYCIVCGTKKISQEDWKNLSHQPWGKSPASCDKPSCLKEVDFMAGFIPRKHYLDDFHQVTSPTMKEQEFLDEVGLVTSFIRFDRIYKNKEEMEKEIPGKFLKEFETLEKYPIETRIAQIDSTYFHYQMKNHIEPTTSLSSSSDPFLRHLAEYRKNACIF